MSGYAHQSALGYALVRGVLRFVARTCCANVKRRLNQGPAALCRSKQGMLLYIIIF